MRIVRRYSLQQHAQKHDQNTPDHAQHQNRCDRLFVVCCDHGEQVCVLTPHPDEPWVAPASGVEGSKCVYMLANAPNSLQEMHVVAAAQLESAQRVDLQKHVDGELAYVICEGIYISLIWKQKRLLHVVVTGGNLTKYFATANVFLEQQRDRRDAESALL